MATRTKALNIRTTDSEYEEIKRFAAFQGMSVTEFVLGTALDRIADWEDAQSVREYEREKAAGRIETVPWEQVQAEAGLL